MRSLSVSLFQQHRHPLIERLGLLYLLKLFNGKDFGTQAGAYWRMLFVLALMPWMRNYRVRASQDVLNESAKEEDDLVSIRRQVQKEMKYTNEASAVARDNDVFSLRLELDLTRRAYEKVNERNKALMAALFTARDRVKEVKKEKRELKRLLNLASSQRSSNSRDNAQCNLHKQD